MGKKLIITAALCGAGTMKSQTPYVPVTPEEIAADAVGRREGRRLRHPHPRPGRRGQKHHGDRALLLCGQPGPGGAGQGQSGRRPQPHLLRLQVLRGYAPCPPAHPQAGDVLYDPGSMNWANSYIFANSPSFLERLGTLCQKEAIKP